MTTTKPMLAVPFKPEKHKQFPVAVEPKLDGVRSLYIDGCFFSRELKPFVNLKELEQLLTHFKGFVLDGEVVALDGTFKSTVSRVRAHEGVNDHIPVAFHIFDMLTEEEWETGNCALPYFERRERLVSQILTTQWNPKYGNKIEIVDSYSASNHTQINAILDACLQQGFEGTGM